METDTALSEFPAFADNKREPTRNSRVMCAALKKEVPTKLFLCNSKIINWNAKVILYHKYTI